MTTWTPAGVKNDVGIILSSTLGAAKDIHIVSARLDHDHGLQPYLQAALHSVLVAAAQCQQMFVSLGQFPRVIPDDEGAG